MTIIHIAVNLTCVRSNMNHGKGSPAGGGYRGDHERRRRLGYSGAGLSGRERVHKGGEDHSELHEHRQPDGVEKAVTGKERKQKLTSKTNYMKSSDF